MCIRIFEYYIYGNGIHKVDYIKTTVKNILHAPFKKKQKFIFIYIIQLINSMDVRRLNKLYTGDENYKCVTFETNETLQIFI